eukprot:scaffold20770_cov65-Phaeocystis_antarctica.AAC.2
MFNIEPTTLAALHTNPHQPNTIHPGVGAKRHGAAEDLPRWAHVRCREDCGEAGCVRCLPACSSWDSRNAGKGVRTTCPKPEGLDVKPPNTAIAAHV